ncbi:MAG: hemerythrin domain-containing protein [Acidobacteria bacterium]|nr:hemerythrin domain-containing protein [Acidobacteriota bacterium]
MHGKEILDTLLREHQGLRQHLEEWEAALRQATGSSYGQCQQAVSVLRDLCQVFEHELRHHIREEETVFYPAVEYRLPRLRALLGELRHEHDVFRQAFEEFRRELLHFNATGELRRLLPLGRELVGLLRQHVDREERELHPIVLHEFGEEDWRELRRLYVDSEVA